MYTVVNPTIGLSMTRHAGRKVEVILLNVGYDKELIPIKEVFRDSLLDDDITNLEEYIEDLRSEWTLSQVLPSENLDNYINGTLKQQYNGRNKGSN